MGTRRGGHPGFVERAVTNCLHPRVSVLGADRDYARRRRDVRTCGQSSHH